MSLFTAGHANRPPVEGDSPTQGEKGVIPEGFMPNTDAPRPLPRIHGCRLVGLTERNSSVMKVSKMEEFASHDPIIKAFGTSANNTTRDVVVSGQISVVPEDTFADTLATETTIFILGRSVTALGGDSSGSGSSSIRGTLGSVPSSLANEIKRTATSNVSPLIVQAKQTAPERTGLDRKPSTASHAHAPS